MVPHNYERTERTLEHQVTSVLTSDASTDAVPSPALSLVDEELVDQQLFFVTSYSDFDKVRIFYQGCIILTSLFQYF